MFQLEHLAERLLSSHKHLFTATTSLNMLYNQVPLDISSKIMGKGTEVFLHGSELVHRVGIYNIDNHCARIRENDLRLYTKYQDLPEVLLVGVGGACNAGKSTLLNTLLADKTKALQSKKPGSTRSIEYYLLNPKKPYGFLIDSPGYGYAKVSRWERRRRYHMLLKFIGHGIHLSKIILVCNPITGLQEDDLKLIGQINRMERALQIVITKTDKLRRGEDLMKVLLRTSMQIQRFKYCSPVIHVLSTHTSFGVKELASVLAMNYLKPSNEREEELPIRL